MTFSEASRELREHAGLTQEQLARELNCNLRSVLHYENDQRFPKPDVLYSYIVLAKQYAFSELEDFFRKQFRLAIKADAHKPITI